MAGESRSVEIGVNVREHGLEGYLAEVVELPGCVASGNTPQELDESLREAIEAYLSTSETHVEVTNVFPAQRDGHRPTGRHARPDEHLESRTVELTLR